MSNGLSVERAAKVGRGLVVPALLIVVWETLTRLHLANARLLVPPEQVVKSAVAFVRGGDLFGNLKASLVRDLTGFAFGSAAGLLVGSIMGTSRLSERLIGPSFHAAKQVALFAWIPLMSVWLGTGELAKVVFIALSAFYPVVVNTYEGIRGIGREYVEVARAFRFTRWQVLRKVVLPGALPSIFAGIHLALIYSWLGTLGAEYLLAPALGVGNLMIDGRERLAMDQVILGLVVAGLIGFGLNSVASAAESHFLRWRVRNV